MFLKSVSYRLRDVYFKLLFVRVAVFGSVFVCYGVGVFKVVSCAYE